MQSLPLKTFLLAGSIIAGSGSSTSSPDLKAVLTSRLKEYAGLLGHSPIEDVISLEEVQAETASASLYVLKGVQDLLLENGRFIAAVTRLNIYI